VLRDAIYQLNGTLPDAEPLLWDHVLHCVEAVRQAVKCSLDPTLLPMADTWPGIPNGQKHSCRNEEALRRWADDFAHPPPVWKTFIPNISPHTTFWLARNETHRAAAPSA
jgi:hypothetical protein